MNDVFVRYINITICMNLSTHGHIGYLFWHNENGCLAGSWVMLHESILQTCRLNVWSKNKSTYKNLKKVLHFSFTKTIQIKKYMYLFSYIMYEYSLRLRKYQTGGLIRNN